MRCTTLLTAVASCFVCFAIASTVATAVPIPTVVFNETFDTNTADLATTLSTYSALTGTGLVNVGSQEVKIFRGTGNNLLTATTFNEEIWVSGDLGMPSSSPGFGGSFSPGLVIGDKVFNFFPGFGGGSFRINEYSVSPGVLGAPLVGNNNMGFTPAGDVLHHMTVHWDGALGFDVEIIDGNNPLNVYAPATFTLSAFSFGGVGFSGVNGGATANAMFDNLSVTALVPVPEPSSFLLLGLGALGLVRHTRRRRPRGLANTVGQGSA